MKKYLYFPLFLLLLLALFLLKEENSFLNLSPRNNYHLEGPTATSAEKLQDEKKDERIKRQLSSTPLREESSLIVEPLSEPLVVDPSEVGDGQLE